MKELRKNCKYSLVVPTSMGVRITPENGQPVQASDMFRMQATSAETNVASISSYLTPRQIPPVRSNRISVTFLQKGGLVRFPRRENISDPRLWAGREKR